MMWLTLWLIILAGLSHMEWQIFVSVEFTHTHTIYCIIERHLCWFSNLQLQTPVCDRLATRSGCTLLLTIFGRWNWLQHSFHSQQVDNMWGMNIQLTPKNRKRRVFFLPLLPVSHQETGQDNQYHCKRCQTWDPRTDSTWTLNHVKLVYLQQTWGLYTVTVKKCGLYTEGRTEGFLTMQSTSWLV